jgi:hypothetical protein
MIISFKDDEHVVTKVYFSLHIWKEHIEIDQITNFREKINWQSLLYRIPLRHGLRDQNHFCTRLRRDVSQLLINASKFV